jgi:hypothetical protein
LLHLTTHGQCVLQSKKTILQTSVGNQVFLVSSPLAGIVSRGAQATDGRDHEFMEIARVASAVFVMVIGLRGSL